MWPVPTRCCKARKPQASSRPRAAASPAAPARCSATSSANAFSASPANRSRSSAPNRPRDDRFSSVGSPGTHECVPETGGILMPERDGYIPGVPCWVDSSQPDPEAGARFYADLFGWEVEDVMPPEAPGRYFIGRIRGGDVGAVASIPEGAPPVA